MYENYLSATENGVKDVEIDVDSDEYWIAVGDSQTGHTNPEAVSVKVIFAVGTEEEAWVTIDGSGNVSPSFGGVGICDNRLQEYIQQAVGIWRGVTGSEKACKLTKSI
jgi:hypothetical protein